MPRTETQFNDLEVMFRPKGAKHTKYDLAGAKVRLEPFRNPNEDFDRYLLHVSGIVLNAEHVEAEPAKSAAAGESPSMPPTGPEEQTSTMYDLFEAWKGCTKCPLHEHRQCVVFGSGNDIAAKYLVIGEAPGSEEERQGVPFIGVTGSKLRNALAQLGSDPDRDGYITNSVICFPRRTAGSTEFRAPAAEEILACRPRLNEQFSILMRGGALRGVLLVGKNAHLSFFHRAALEAGKYKSEGDFAKFKMQDALGWYAGAVPPEWGQLKVMSVYHPSYFMRQKWDEGTHPMWVAWKQDLAAFLQWTLHGKFQNPRVI